VLPTVEAVASGSLDEEFQPFSKAPGHNYWRDYWLKISPQDPPAVEGLPVIILNTTRGLHAEVVAFRNGSAVPLPRITQLPAFLGGRDNLFALPEGVPAAQPLYAHLTSESTSRQYLSVSLGSLERTLAVGTERARMIALTFGALMAVSLAANTLVAHTAASRRFASAAVCTSNALARPGPSKSGSWSVDAI